MSQEQLQQVQQLLNAGRYEDALAILRTIDSPQAQQLIQRVEQALATRQQAPAPAEAAAPDLLDRLSQAAAPQAAAPQAAAPSPEPAPSQPPPRRQEPEVLADGRRVYQEGVYEMLWDCQYCGTTKLLAKTHRFCPNCGAAQNPDSRYFPSEDEYVAVQDHVYVGADKTCPSCNGLNSGNAEFCGNCGAPLTQAAQAKMLETQKRGQGERFASSGSRDIVKERFDAEMERVGVKPKAGVSKSSPWLKYGLIGLGVVVVAAILALVFWTRQSTVYVTGHSWEREIRIDAYGPQNENTWCSDGLPAGAYNVSRRSEVHHTNQVPDGEECETQRVDQGDGTFRQERVCHTRYRDEPVYADMCYYTIDRWAYARSVWARGNSREETPTWPVPNLACEGQPRIGCEREAGRNETYLLHLHASEGDATYTCGIDRAQWDNAAIESLWTLTVGVIGGEPRCDTLQPAQ